MVKIEDLVVKNVLEGLPVGLLVIGHNGLINVVNPAAAEILGYPREELLDRGWGELFLVNDANHLFNQVFLDVIQKEKVGLNRDVPYETPGGGRMRLSVTSSFLRSGDELAIVVLLHDVTEIYRMREREVAALMEKTRLQQETIGSLNNLALSVAHQIRNPAFAIGGFARRLSELLSRSGLESEYPGIIAEEARRLERIVTSVVRLASMPGATFARVFLPGAADAAAREAAALAAARGKRLAVNHAAAQEWAMADPALLAVCLGELFANSVDFALGGEVRIDLSARPNGDFLELAVADDGPGVRAAITHFLFDPFFTSKADGVGMGLTLARRIALEHGGDLRLDATAAAGARFVLRLRRESLAPAGASVFS
ncbi:MAG: PAS domain S-box protein [Desulfovibrionaceae bacterium]|nr:PAS domain S-box protein [Desulfovibrionaceae bacterium]MBF0513981.1 PAS domain S-box protein [Desulfovibrionaceae bacterium]